jgi:menaquinone-dependent protoporphyrinogen oxidase
VSGAAGSAKPEDRARAAGFIREFLAETEWRPGMTETIGGAITYTKYNPILRWIMRRIARRDGGPTDTSRDHELTDWAQVDRFALAFAARLPAVIPPLAPVAA